MAHSEPGYEALRAKAHAVYAKNADALKAKLAADKAAEDAKDAAAKKADKKAGK